MIKDTTERRRPFFSNTGCLTAISIPLLLLAGMYVVGSMERLAINNFRSKVYQLRIGTKTEDVRAHLGGQPVALCKDSKELGRVMAQYKNQFKDAVRPINGSVLVYKLREEDEYLVCLYFDTRHRLEAIVEAWRKEP